MNHAGLLVFIAIVMIVLALSGCSMDRYICKETQSKAPECAQYRED